jgi:ApbE superfamily uncharacterized protein (UPF0280 family)
MEPVRFTIRDYRERARPEGLVFFGATVLETDLWIAAETDLKEEAERSIRQHRAELEHYIGRHPDFVTTFSPWKEPFSEGSVVAAMVTAANMVGTGPMSAVAGSLAEVVARDLSRHSPQVLVENGGDLYLLGTDRARVGLWAGLSPLSGRIALALDPEGGIAVCTSSGTVGPSYSFGQSDCATVISPSGALADAAATELGNRVKAPSDIEDALDWVLSLTGVMGAVIIIGEVFGAKGEVELVPVNKE